MDVRMNAAGDMHEENLALRKREHSPRPERHANTLGAPGFPQASVKRMSLREQDFGRY
jgi:hypothetical protein